MKLLAAYALALLPFSAMADPLELVCGGEAVGTDTQTTYGSATTSDGVSVDATSDTYRKVRSPARVWLKVTDDQTASIKLPRSLVPPLHSGGADFWWPVSDLKITDQRINVIRNEDVGLKAEASFD